MAPDVPTASGSVARRRRRSAGSDQLKKLTLRLHETVAAAIREIVASGEAPSTDAFVEQAVIAQLRERRKQRVYAAYAAAAADPVFMAELEATTRAFDHTVADGLANPQD